MGGAVGLDQRTHDLLLPLQIERQRLLQRETTGKKKREKWKKREGVDLLHRVVVPREVEEPHALVVRNVCETLALIRNGLRNACVNL
eukprot:2698418-Rhodomonas_salina.1